MRNIKTAEEIKAEAVEYYYRDKDAEARYESAYVLGWMTSQYNLLANELRETKNKKKHKEI
jgi:hypothetical protein